MKKISREELINAVQEALEVGSLVVVFRNRGGETHVKAISDKALDTYARSNDLTAETLDYVESAPEEDCTAADAEYIVDAWESPFGILDQKGYELI